MKRQVGMRVDGGVWDAYKKVCVREELRPNVGVSLDDMLLSVLRNVSDPRLRSKIRKTLTAKRDDQKGKTDSMEESEGKEDQDSEELESIELMPSSVAERIKGIRKQAVGLELNAEEKQKILKKIRDIRESLKRR